MNPLFVIVLEPSEAARRVEGWPEERRLLAWIGRDDAVLACAVDSEGLLDLLPRLPAHPAMTGRESVELDFAREAALIGSVYARAADLVRPPLDIRRATANEHAAPGFQRPDAQAGTTDPSPGIAAGSAGACAPGLPKVSWSSRLFHDFAYAAALAASFILGLVG